MYWCPTYTFLHFIFPLIKSCIDVLHIYFSILFFHGLNRVLMSYIKDVYTSLPTYIFLDSILLFVFVIVNLTYLLSLYIYIYILHARYNIPDYFHNILLISWYVTNTTHSVLFQKQMARWENNETLSVYIFQHFNSFRS